MAAAQDVEQLLNSIAKCRKRGSQSQLRVEVTVLRVHNVPHIKKQFGLKRRFFVTVFNHATMKKTQSVQIDGQTVQWNQRLGAIFIQRSSHLKVEDIRNCM